VNRALLVWALAGCVKSTPLPDDAGGPNPPPQDAGPALDAAPREDSGPQDAGPPPEPDCDPPAAAADGWSYETLARDDAGFGIAIEIDSTGAPEVAYYAYYDGADVRWATRGAEGWHIEDAVTEADHGEYVSLALDSSGAALVAYEGSADLRLATRAGGAWTHEIAYAGFSGGWWTSIATDAEDAILVSSIDAGRVKISTRAGGAWSTEDIGEGGNTTSIAVDGAGRAHVCFSAPRNTLQYATNAGGAWTVEEAAGTFEDLGFSCALALDADGRAHIAYQGDDDLRYTTNASGAWQAETIDTGGGVYNSIAVDESGVVHVSFAPNSGGIGYATDAGGAWTVTTIDPGGYGASLALSPGVVHVAYWSGTDVRYARTPPAPDCVAPGR